MKFLLSFFLWVFGVEAPVDLKEEMPISRIEMQTIEPGNESAARRVIGPKDRRFGGHIIIFEDTHFRKQND